MHSRKMPYAVFTIPRVLPSIPVLVVIDLGVEGFLRRLWCGHVRTVLLHIYWVQLAWYLGSERVGNTRADPA